MHKGYGPVHILHALGQRGIPEHLAREYLQAEHTDWPARAEAARRKKFGADRPKNYREQARQSRFLSNRGFTGEQIRTCFEDVEP